MKKYAYSIDYSDGNFLIRTMLNAPGQTEFDISMDCLKLRIRLVEKVIPNSEWKVEEHQHSFFELHIIPYGKGYINIEGEDFQVKGGQLYITGPGIKHSQLSDSDNPMTEYCLAFEICDVDSYTLSSLSQKSDVAEFKESLSKVYPYAFEDVYEIRVKFEDIFKEVEEHSVGYKFRIKILVTEILINVLRTVASKRGIKKHAASQKTVQGQRINKICKFVVANYMNEIRVDDVARFLFLSPKQVNRILKKEFNQTFHDYLIYYRLLCAKAVAEETDLTVEEIAYKCGFSNANHLYQVFRRFNCPSPSKLRNLVSDQT